MKKMLILVILFLLLLTGCGTSVQTGTVKQSDQKSSVTTSANSSNFGSIVVTPPTPSGDAIDYSQFNKKTWIMNKVKQDQNGVSIIIYSIENGKFTGEIKLTLESNNEIDATIKLLNKSIESSLHSVQPPEGTFRFTPWNIKDVKMFSSIEDQSFMVKLNSWGDVRFVSGKYTGANYVSLGFYLTNKAGDIFHVFDSAFTDCSEIRAVSFKDVNSDGLTDIIKLDKQINNSGKNKDVQSIVDFLSHRVDSDIYSELPDTFMFSSGAGAWSTEVEIKPDGSFVGYYHDSDMGGTGDGYPNGTRYECSFSGKFIDLKKVNNYEYSMRVEYIKTKEADGKETIIDGVRVIYAQPYGLDKADEFRLYLPGRSTADLPEEFLNWVRGQMGDFSKPSVMPNYGLYNVAGQEGFCGDSTDSSIS